MGIKVEIKEKTKKMLNTAQKNDTVYIEVSYSYYDENDDEVYSSLTRVTFL